MRRSIWRAAGRPRNPLPIGRRPRIHGHDRRARARSISSCPPASSAKRNCSRSGSGCPSGTCTTAVNYMLSAQGFSIAREHRSAGLCGRRDVRGGRQGKGRRRQAHRPEARAEGLRADDRSTARWASGSWRSRPVETAADGTARQTLKLDKGGDYVVRAEGIDRFQNADHRAMRACRFPATRTRSACASWPTPTATRWATRPRSKSIWRETPALGLVTFQGARVLDYRLVELKTGVNESADSDDTRAGAELRSVGGGDGTRTEVRERKTKRPATAVAGGANRAETACSGRSCDSTRPAARSTWREIASQSRREAKGERRKRPATPPRPGEEVEVTVTDDRSAGQAGGGRGEPGDGRAIAVGPFPRQHSRRFRTSSRPAGGGRPSRPPPASRSPTIRRRSRSTLSCWPRKTVWRWPPRKRPAVEPPQPPRAAANLAAKPAAEEGAGATARSVATTEVSEPETEQGEGPEAESQLNPHGGASKRHVAHGPGGMRRSSRISPRPRQQIVRPIIVKPPTGIQQSSPAKTAGQPLRSPCRKTPRRGGCWPKALRPTRWPARPTKS